MKSIMYALDALLLSAAVVCVLVALSGEESRDPYPTPAQEHACLDLAMNRCLRDDPEPESRAFRICASIREDPCGAMADLWKVDLTGRNR